MRRFPLILVLTIFMRDFTCFCYVCSRRLGFNAFYRWFRAEVTARKDFLLAFVAFYRWFCACDVTVGANLLLHFLVFDRLRRPVTVEADILSSLIVFYNWFCKKATVKADFLGSCRKNILSLISFISWWRSNEIFYIFFFKYFNSDFMSNTPYSKMAANKLFFFFVCMLISPLCLIFTSKFFVFYTCWRGIEG